MNNLQLSVFITSYADHLRLIRNNLSGELYNKVEHEIIKERGKWKGDGDPPAIPYFSKESDWEWLEEDGCPLCLIDLDEFIDDLQDAANILMTGKKNE